MKLTAIFSKYFDFSFDQYRVHACLQKHIWFIDVKSEIRCSDSKRLRRKRECPLCTKKLLKTLKKTLKTTKVKIQDFLAFRHILSHEPENLILHIFKKILKHQGTPLQEINKKAYLPKKSFYCITSVSSILQLNVLLSNHLNYNSHARLPPSLAIVPAAGEETNYQIATLESNKLIPINMKVYNCVSFNNQNKIVICCLLI